MKDILAFIEKHKEFIKKCIMFFIIYFVLTLTNNSQIIEYFNKIFTIDIGKLYNVAISTFLINMKM